MARLTEEQAKQLEELERLRDAPDSNGPGHSFIVDLGDPKQVRFAKARGWLTDDDLADDDTDGDDGDGGDGPEPDEKPKRRRRLLAEGYGE